MTLFDQIHPHLQDPEGPDAKGNHLSWCPFHADGQGKPPHQKNLSVHPEKGFICHACGAKGGLKKLAKHFGVSGAKKEVVATYDYVDERGELLFQVVRYEPKGFRQRRPNGNGGWIWKLDGVRRVPYQLPELIAAMGAAQDGDRRACFPEGERDVLNLWRLGCPATTNPMGAKNWDDRYAMDMKVAGVEEVVVLPDNDAAGERHAIAVSKSCFRAGLKVKIVRLPDLPPKGDISDWINAGHTKEELERLVSEAPQIQEAVDSKAGTLSDAGPWVTGQSGKIRIDLEYWTEALDEMTHLAWAVVNQANDPPFLFRSGAAPVRIELEDDGSPFIRPVNDHRLRHLLMQIAEWWKQNDKGQWERRALPAQLINNMLACPKIPLPVLSGIVESPVFSADGQLQTTPGYNLSTKTYFDASSGVIIPPVSDQPSPTEVAEARRIILVEILGDFPFIGEAETAHAVAMFLLPFAREIIRGPTPFHLLEKPAPGTGATILAELPGIVFTGRATSAMTEGRDDDEWRKRLFAKLRKGQSIIFLDNIRRRIDSAAFSSALTAWPWWEDRILGFSEILRVPVRALWIGSGNNPAVSNEVSRRTIRIRLDAKVDRPWLRDGFRHPNLREWVRQNRGQVLWACLTLIRAWFAAGRPPGTRVLGMFEDWAKTMGGILDSVEIPGFLGNLDEFYAQSDEEGAAWRGFLSAWWGEHRDKPVLVKELYKLALQCDGLELGEGKEQSQRTKLGQLIARMKDRVSEIEVTGQPSTIQLRVVQVGLNKRAANWRLIEQPVRVVSLGEPFPLNGEFFPEKHPSNPGSLAEKIADEPHPPSPKHPTSLEESSEALEKAHPPSPTSPSPAPAPVPGKMSNGAEKAHPPSPGSPSVHGEISPPNEALPTAIACGSGGTPCSPPGPVLPPERAAALASTPPEQVGREKGVEEEVIEWKL
jgi:Toprim domain-containing protein